MNSIVMRCEKKFKCWQGFGFGPQMTKFFITKIKLKPTRNQAITNFNFCFRPFKF